MLIIELTVLATCSNEVQYATILLSLFRLAFAGPIQSVSDGWEVHVTQTNNNMLGDVALHREH